MEKICEAASITLNRNAVHGDASALSPGGVCVGAPAMTTRGCGTEDFQRIGDFLDRCCRIALKIQEEKGKKLKDFEDGLQERSSKIIFFSTLFSSFQLFSSSYFMAFHGFSSLWLGMFTDFDGRSMLFFMAC